MWIIYTKLKMPKVKGLKRLKRCYLYPVKLKADGMNHNALQLKAYYNIYNYGVEKEA